MSQPDVQVISSLVVQRADGDVLLIRYDGEDERWWLPGDDLEPYEHPDDAAERFLARDLPGLEWETPEMLFVESFRGRRGWHVIFHYAVRGTGEAAGDRETGWFAPADLPRTFHGSWERNVVARATELMSVT